MTDKTTIVKMRFGSHLYGTATLASDTDYKGIYLPTLRDVLLHGPIGHDSTSTKADERAKNTADDVDLQMFSLAKFIDLAVEGETVCIDMLHVNHENLVHTSDIWRDLVKNRHKFYSKNMKAFLGYCRRQAAKYGIKGSRLQVMETVLAMLNHEKAGATTPDPRLGEYWTVLPVTEHSKFETHKGSNGDEEFYVICGKLYNKTTAAWRVKESIQKMYSEYGHRAQLAKTNEGIDWKALSHAIRAATQLVDIYEFGGFEYPLKNAPLLLKIKRGELDYKTEVAPMLEKAIETVEGLAALSEYPDKVDRAFWDTWLLKVFDQEYGLNGAAL